MSFDMYVDGVFHTRHNNVTLLELRTSYYYVPPMSDPNYIPHS